MSQKNKKLNTLLSTNLIRLRCTQGKQVADDTHQTSVWSQSAF